MKLKEEQEEYIIKAQHEKLALKQEMENKSKFLEETKLQLEEVRFNRERMDQDVMVSTGAVPVFSSFEEFLLMPRVFILISYPMAAIPNLFDTRDRFH